jgi:hypothetical protein
MHRAWTPGQQPEESVGLGIVSDPYAAARADGTVDVFAVNGLGQLVHRSLGATGWSAWQSLGGGFGADPRHAPSAPTKVSVAPGNGSATVHWAPPKTNGGAPVTAFVVTAFVGSEAVSATSVAPSARSATLSGLANAKAYTFSVVASNATGAGPASVPTPSLRVGTPTAPKRVTAGRGVKQATVKWLVSGANGAKITRYTATCTSSNHGVARSKAGKKSPILVTGLTRGKKYACTVKATNSRGAGPASSPSNAFVA